MSRSGHFSSVSSVYLCFPHASSNAPVWHRMLPIVQRIFVLACLAAVVSTAAEAGDLTIPKQFPIKDPQGRPTLSPPHIYQTNECATKVYVDSFKPHATINIYLLDPPNPRKLIGGPVDSFFGHDAIPLTQTLHTNDELEATQTVNGVTSAYSTRMKVGAMPTSLHDPDVLPPFYACGQVVPVDGLVSGVNLEVQDQTAGTIIGADSIPNVYSSDGWDPPTVSPLEAPPKTSPAHEVRAKQSACTGVHSNYGPAKKIDAQPVPCNHPPTVQPPIVGNDAVTVDNLYTGAVVQIYDHSTLESTTLATGSSNSDGLSHPVKASSDIRAEQTLCKSCGKSGPVKPTKEIPRPTLVSPICPGQPAAFVQNSTVNATLVLLHGATVIGYGGAAPGEVPIYLAPPATFNKGDDIQVAEYIGSNIVDSNKVKVGCQERMRWQDFISGPDGANRLKSLKAGIQKMKSLDSSPPGSADYRRSWAYWANIHGYYGNLSPDGTVADHISYLQTHGLGGDVSYYSSITDQSPPDSTAQTVWATCQHSSGPTPATGQALNFFGWHRMWLYYLERVLRWAAKDDTLRLPYWDYTNPAQVALPAEFQSTASDLYDALRDPSMNSGTMTLDVNSTDISAYLPETDYFTYEYDIENNVHGYVHCTVGPTCPVAHMGDVPVAGNDPIFPAHHANIDRFWACWQYLHPTPPGSWQDEQFSFVDETGAMQTKPVKDFLDSVPLGYVYDNVTDCGKQKAGGGMRRAKPFSEQAAPAGGKSTTTVLGSVKAVPIKSPETTVDISVQPSALQGVLSQPEGAATVALVLGDVTAKGPPGVLFNVYLASKEKPAARQFAGTLSWFGAFSHHGSSGGLNRTFHFPVTEQLRQLMGAGNTSGFTVTIEATTGRVPAGKSNTEAEQAEAAKAFRPEAELQIGTIELQARSAATQ